MDDSSRLFSLLSHLGWSIHIPHETAEYSLQHAIALSRNCFEAKDAHRWMEAGYSSAHEACQKGWPVYHLESQAPSEQPPLLPHALCIETPPLQLGPPLENYVIFTDASLLPAQGLAGGACGIWCLDSHAWMEFPVPIPVAADSSYMAESYTIWFTLYSLHANPAWPLPRQHFTDSQSFIDAFQNASSTYSAPHLNAKLLEAVRKLAGPRYPFCHMAWEASSGIS